MNMSTEKLRTNRNFWKYFFLQFLTLDIYEAVMMSNISKEVNLVAKDGKRTMDYMKIFLTSIIALLMLAMILKACFYKEAEINVVENACAGVTKESHDAAINTMKMCQINVIGE